MGSRTERGVTLTELTIVMVLAALVTIGLVTFYLNSQGMWLDASSQSLTQRDATLVLERMTAEAHGSAHAGADSLNQTVIFYETDGTTEKARFWLNSSDSLIHYGLGPSAVDKGPIAASRVQQFLVDTNDTLVYLRALRMTSTTGQPVEISSTMALYSK